MALGIWGGVSGLGVAIGPLVGGAVVSGISWHWIFWINVPVGLVLVPLALTRLTESRGPGSKPRPARPGAGRARPARHHLRSDPRSGAGMDERDDPRLVRARDRVRDRVRGLGAAGSRSRCCRCGSSAHAQFAATNGLSFAMFFGVFGGDLPAGPVLPDHAGLLAAAGRAADAAVDGHADDRRADRRDPQRPRSDRVR